MCTGEMHILRVHSSMFTVYAHREMHTAHANRDMHTGRCNGLTGNGLTRTRGMVQDAKMPSDISKFRQSALLHMLMCLCKQEIAGCCCELWLCCAAVTLLHSIKWLQ